MEQIEGVIVSFRGMANSVFAGAVVGLNPDGELVLEMAEGDCDRPSNQPRDVCAHIPNTCGRCGLSSLRGSRLAAIARV